MGCPTAWSEQLALEGQTTPQNLGEPEVVYNLGIEKQNMNLGEAR